MSRSFQDPMMARFAHVQRAQQTFVYTLKNGSKVGYNPEPGGEVKAVNTPAYAALKVMYQLFVQMDLDEFNAKRAEAGQAPLRRIEAVIDEAPLHMPTYVDEIGPNGYPLEITANVFQFAARFFRASIKASSNGGRGPRPARKLTDTPIIVTKPAEPALVVAGAKRRPRRGKRRPQAVAAAS